MPVPVPATMPATAPATMPVTIDAAAPTFCNAPWNNQHEPATAPNLQQHQPCAAAPKPDSNWTKPDDFEFLVLRWCNVCHKKAYGRKACNNAQCGSNSWAAKAHHAEPPAEQPWKRQKSWKSRTEAATEGWKPRHEAAPYVAWPSWPLAAASLDGLTPAVSPDANGTTAQANSSFAPGLVVEPPAPVPVAAYAGPPGSPPADSSVPIGFVVAPPAPVPVVAIIPAAVVPEVPTAPALPAAVVPAAHAVLAAVEPAPPAEPAVPAAAVPAVPAEPKRRAKIAKPKQRL